MKREEIIAQYAIDERGIIQTPGKFEGERLYVPHFWQVYLEGGASHDNGYILRFYLTPEDRAEFPELKARKVVRLIQRDDGFIRELWR